MSGLINSIYGADRVSQSIALMGGATAHSYSAVGLQFSPAFTEVTSQSLEPISVVSALNDSRQHVESTGSALGQTTVIESISKLPAGMAQFSALDDEPANFLAQNLESAMLDIELLSRYESFESFLEVISSPVADIGGASPGALMDSDESTNGMFLLTDIFAEAIVQARESQTEFENTFDESRQGPVQEFIKVTDDELAIDFIGVVSQPIGSLALPQLDAVLTNQQDELFNAFA